MRISLQGMHFFELKTVIPDEYSTILINNPEVYIFFWIFLYWGGIEWAQIITNAISNIV